MNETVTQKIGLRHRFFGAETKVDFLGKRWIAFLLSVILLVTASVSLYQRGLNFGIDFTGGIVIEVRFNKDVSMAELRALLTENAPDGLSLQRFGEQNDILIKIQSDSNPDDETAQAALVKLIQGLLNNQYSDIDFRKVDYVGPQISKELIEGGAYSLGLAFLAILLYIWFRFEWQFGLGAIIALVHDVFLTIGFMSLMQIEFNQSSIAAILTIVGYSINDSVVIFDRVRENLRRYKKMLPENLLNISINSTLSRTLLTAGTTIVALLALIILGGNVIEGFSMAVLFGVVIGTYSSIYIASPILIYMQIREEKELQEDEHSHANHS